MLTQHPTCTYHKECNQRVPITVLIIITFYCYCHIGSYNAAFPCNSKKAGFTPCTLVGIRAGAGGIRWAMLVVYYQERMQCIRCVGQFLVHFNKKWCTLHPCLFKLHLSGSSLSKLVSADVMSSLIVTCKVHVVQCVVDH